MQMDYAKELAIDLQDCGIDVTYLDILDCLAVCGLALVKDEDAARAYFAEMERAAN